MCSDQPKLVAQIGPWVCAEKERLSRSSDYSGSGAEAPRRPSQWRRCLRPMVRWTMVQKYLDLKWRTPLRMARTDSIVVCLENGCRNVPNDAVVNLIDHDEVFDVLNESTRATMARAQVILTEARAMDHLHLIGTEVQSAFKTG